jgi:hypothetical protein
MAKKDSKKKVVAKKANAKSASSSKKADKKGTAAKKTASKGKPTPKSKPATKKVVATKKSAVSKSKPVKTPVSKKVTKVKPVAKTQKAVPVAKAKKEVKQPKVVAKPVKVEKAKVEKVKVEKVKVEKVKPVKVKKEKPAPQPKAEIKTRPVVQKQLAKPVTNKKPEIIVPKMAKPIQIDPKDKMNVKKQLLAKCLDIQTNIITNAKKAMDDAQQSANEEKNSNEEMTDSFRETMQATRDVYARQVQEGINTLGLLNRIMIKPLEVVKFGAVVVTDFQNYFISAGLGEVKIDDKNFVTVSTLTPLYQILSEKKKGDLFMFLDRKYRILDVF